MINGKNNFKIFNEYCFRLKSVFINYIRYYKQKILDCLLKFSD